MAARAVARTFDPVSPAQREQRLRAMLNDRRRMIMDEVHGGLRRVRADVTSRPLGSQDDAELADADLQDELRLSLIQMKAETLDKIDEALLRLEEERYGFCHECDDPIAPGRLEALPFAIRCTACESRREAGATRPSGFRDANASAVA
ncbi:MAG: TraR/DksA C4-type zinc finger protein [Acidobacteriota bacterium]